MPTDARPNETRLMEVLEETLPTCDEEWHDMFCSVIAYLSDDEVRAWTRCYGIEDEIYEDEEEDEE